MAKRTDDSSEGASIYPFVRHGQARDGVSRLGQASELLEQHDAVWRRVQEGHRRWTGAAAPAPVIKQTAPVITPALPAVERCASTGIVWRTVIQLLLASTTPFGFIAPALWREGLHGSAIITGCVASAGVVSVVTLFRRLRPLRTPREPVVDDSEWAAQRYSSKRSRTLTRSPRASR